MMVVDSSALDAILGREPEADAWLEIIAAANLCLLPAGTLLETGMVLAGRASDASTWIEPDERAVQAGMEVVPQDATLTEAARAALLRYGRGRHDTGLKLGDCSVYALGRSRNLPLLFKGDDFARTVVEAVG